MIDKLSLKNFKAFKEIKDLELKPLTVICGVNSSGKSSLIQSLLLLKQSLFSEIESNALSFNGPHIFLSGLSDLYFAFSKSEKIEYSLSVNSLRVPSSLPSRDNFLIC